MRRKFRLSSSTDFKRVWREGKSFAHPLLVLVALASANQPLQIGIVAGRSVGGAVQRNRAKRLLREAIRPFLAELPAGWHMIMIARPATRQASLLELRFALQSLLRRARLINGYPAHVDEPTGR